METKPTAAKVPVQVGVDERGVVLRDVDQMFRFATAVSQSGLAPKGLDTPNQVFVALAAGTEAGLKPMQSLGAVVVINGRVSWMATAAKGIIRAAGLLKPGTDFETTFTGKPGDDDWTAIVTAHRVGLDKPVSGRFSVADAKRANLWNPPKGGPWKTYPARMLAARAFGFLSRDHFSDALMGLCIEEEARDIPPERDAEHVVVHTPAEDDPLLAGVLEPQGTVEVIDIRPEPAKASAEPQVAFPWDEPSGSIAELDASEQALMEWQSACVDLDPNAQVEGLDLQALKALHAKLEAAQ